MAEKQKFTCDPNIWVDEFSDEFFRFAMYRVKNREVAEDLVQETFLSALKSLKNFRRDCPEKSWLYNILRNKIIDHFRKKTNQEIKQSSTAVETDDDAFFGQFFRKGGQQWDNDAAPENWDIAADKIMEREEFMQFLMLCISLLPETWAKVFSLKNIEDFSTNEICKELDITPSNLWTIIHRAKLQLRGCLEKRWINK
ncbi:MAG: sigma-70 family RNA polymerase sigma factor [Bacteroidetes bacterium]|nr:sigma-70 family RNA polymerase sigma factor [Bacteroidota bacterium]